MSTPFPATVDALLARMVQFDTVNSYVSGKPRAEEELSHYLESLACDCFFQTRRLPVPGNADNLLITHQVHRDRPWLLFDSHLDTVGVEGMTIDPFGGEIRGGKLFGRGSCDTKGTGAAMLFALREYADKPPQPNNIAILYSVSEEIGMDGVQHFVRHDLPDLGFTPRGAIIGEPTTLRPVTAHNGVMRFDVITHGVAAHSSVPQLGKSAISMMAKVISAIESNYIAHLDAAHPLTGKAVSSINLIRGGIQVNIIPDHCEVQIDRRVVPGESLAAIAAALESVLADLRASDPSIKVELKTRSSNAALAPESNATLLPHVQSALASLDLSTTPVGAPFCTHASAFAAVGTPAIVVGPGNPLPAHTKDEYIDLDQLTQGVAFYKRLMMSALA